MDETLIEKISFEYEKFKRSKICQAKENIFASSYEVETKKRIYRYLTEQKSLPGEEILLTVPFLLDSIYLEMEKDMLSGDEMIRQCIQKVMEQHRETQRVITDTERGFLCQK